jgi:hypothetical protein
MTLLVEDTARNNLAAWTADGNAVPPVAGAILSPFTSPRIGTTYKQSAEQTVRRLKDKGKSAWFDPATHALQMPNVGDYRYYTGWNLWSGSPNTLDTDGAQSDHIKRVFDVQDDLGVPHLAPTVLLHSPSSETSQRALRMTELAVEIDPDCYISIAGDSAFWSGGSALDAHIGGLSQVAPAGWFVVVTRTLTVLPAPVAREEVHGLCRTVRSLSDDGPVHVSHGDLAALPAVVAGATSVGTGWDSRQRMCAYASYVARDEDDDRAGGGWLTQVTLEGLLSLLGHSDADLLQNQDAQLSQRLVPGSTPPAAAECWKHHAEVLARVINTLQPGNKDSYERLLTAYENAKNEWAAVANAIGVTNRANDWLREAQEGLQLYGQTEGW